MGAAELNALLDDYNGSYIMTFVGYNAGRGRVQALDPRGLRRSARIRGPIRRLGGAHSVCGDTQLRRAHHGKPAGLSLHAPGSGRLSIEADLRRGAVDGSIEVSWRHSLSFRFVTSRHNPITTAVPPERS